MFAAFGVAAKLCDMFFGEKCKNQILAHKIFLNKPFQQISIYKSPAWRTQSEKQLNLTGNENFIKIRKIAFSVKITQGFEICFKI